MRNGLLLLLALTVVGCTGNVHHPSPTTHPLTAGDLLFHVVEDGNAITDVTPGMIDHVAIVLNEDSVIEAVPDGGVKVTHLDSLRHQDGHYLHARVDHVDAKRTIANARQYLGLPYDSLYLADNEAIYCSELVQFSFVDDHGNQLFSPIPMSFHDASGQITPYWTDFYKAHDMDVPEGEPGTNPGELSQRKDVRVIDRLGYQK